MGARKIIVLLSTQEMQEFHDIEEQYLFAIVARIVTHLGKPILFYLVLQYILNPDTVLQVKQNYIC